MTLSLHSSISNEILKEMAGLLDQGYGGSFLVERYTRKIDNLVKGIFNSIINNDNDPGIPTKNKRRDSKLTDSNIALIALGGYGREELAPFSDIDIMFFAPDRVNTKSAEVLLHQLWDTGLTICHSFRTADECIEEALKDLKTRTSMLEARYIAGNMQLYRTFRNKVYPEIAYKNQRNFVRERIKDMEKRHLDSGDSVFILEPNIKEGEGGLRDVHTAYWLSKVALRIEKISDFSGVMNSYDYRRFLSAYDFLLKTRFCLHLNTKRKNDNLTFEYQKNVAERLGFKSSKKFKASERFMRYYYLKSKVIKDMTRMIMITCSRPYIRIRKNMDTKKITDDFSVSGGKLVATKENLFSKNPVKIMESFYLYSKTGRKFSELLRDNIRSNLLRINRKTRNSSVAIHCFLDIFKSTRVYDTLHEMHDTGVLGMFIPEFGTLRWLVVHEPYHMYTIDEHTLLAIRNLENLKTTKYKSLENLKVIINGLEQFNVLLIALLFHDIGKGVGGRHHEEEGYKMLKNIMERFNLDSKKRLRIEFLVKNHVLMSKIALRRELSDIEEIARFADAVGDIENLKAIYLITYADMSAVNPHYLSSWKAYLLKDLYERTMDFLSGIKENRTEYIKSLLNTSKKIAVQDLIHFIDEMPERYMLSTTKTKVLEDFKLIEKMKENGFSMRIDTRPEGIVEIVLGAEDSPGLFSRIVGFLSSKGLNIINGRIFTGKNGIVIDKISVSNWKHLWWDGLQNEIEEGLRSIIIDNMPVHIVRRIQKAESLFDIFIELDNEASEEYTLIEIFSPDRMGLLFDISNVMYKKDMNIISARINTESGLAQDVFYIQSNTKKINNSIAQELLSELWITLKG
jgi:[protein-PII] uridylyltransferase